MKNVNVIENSFYINRAFCIPIESEDAKCHADLGDPELSYEDNGYLVFQRGTQWYFTPEADKFGGNRTMTSDKLDILRELFGKENVKPLIELPMINEVEVMDEVKTEETKTEEV